MERTAQVELTIVGGFVIELGLWLSVLSHLRLSGRVLVPGRLSRDHVIVGFLILVFVTVAGLSSLFHCLLDHSSGAALIACSTTITPAKEMFLLQPWFGFVWGADFRYSIVTPMLANIELLGSFAFVAIASTLVASVTARRFFGPGDSNHAGTCRLFGMPYWFTLRKGPFQGLLVRGGFLVTSAYSPLQFPLAWSVRRTICDRRFACCETSGQSV